MTRNVAAVAHIASLNAKNLITRVSSFRVVGRITVVSLRHVDKRGGQRREARGTPGGGNLKIQERTRKKGEDGARSGEDGVIALAFDTLHTSSSLRY